MKVCIKCNETKPLNDYYKHPGMKDGHLNKCKDCTKSEVRKREEKLRQNPEWVEKERERSRQKYYRLGYRGKYKQPLEKRRETIRRFFEKYPEKKKAHNATNNLKPKIKGNHLHHWSYNKKHFKDVIELTPQDHAKVHRFLKYDSKTFFFRDLNGNLLDSREKHLEYINKVIIL